MLITSTFYHKITLLPSFNKSLFIYRTIYATIRSTYHHSQGTYLTVPQRITISKRFMWQWKALSKVVGHAPKLLKALETKAPEAVVALASKADSTPNVLDFSPVTPLIASQGSLLPVPLKYSPKPFSYKDPLAVSQNKEPLSINVPLSSTHLDKATFVLEPNSILSQASSDVSIKTTLDYVKASGMMTFSDNIYGMLYQSTEEGIAFRESCVYQLLHVLYHLKNYSFNTEEELLLWIKDVMMVSTNSTYPYPSGHIHVFKYLMGFKQHCIAYMFAGVGFNPALLNKDLPLVDYTGFNSAVPATTFMETYVLDRAYGTFIKNNNESIKVTAVNPDNLSVLQKQYQSICYQQMKQPNADFNLSFTAENTKNNLKFLDVKFRDSPEKTLPCLKGHISITGSLDVGYYMKRYRGDIGTIIKNKPLTPYKAAAENWSREITKILENKMMSFVEKLTLFYELNDLQMKNDTLDYTMVPGKVVEASHDKEFDLYVTNNKEDLDKLIKETAQDLKQFDLFTKNQTAYLKGITLVLDKIATKMPMVGLEVRAGYLALRKLAIEL